MKIGDVGFIAINADDSILTPPVSSAKDAEWMLKQMHKKGFGVLKSDMDRSKIVKVRVILEAP